MRIPSIIFASLFLLSLSTVLHAQKELQPAFPGLSFVRPLDLQAPGDGSNRLFVVEQRGLVWVFENDSTVTQKTEFLDIQDRVTDGGEMGLLGLVFHPAYADSGYFYVNYTASPPTRTVVARYSVSPANPDSAIKESEFVLLEIDQPFANHNGGQLAFGPDGFLYIGMGDGGGAGDSLQNGQNLQTLLGALLRIDADTTTATTNYGIPSDNPFVGNDQGYREEIYAYGLRNPWRFSFDRATGRLWLADVGQSLYEEVDLIEKGHNYGWNIMEGYHCHIPPTGCDTTGLTLPVWEYAHSEGRSVTGGYVYTGSRAPDLAGKYIYGDFVSGKIWSLEYDGVNPPINTELLDAALSVASFGVDEDGELYVCAFDGNVYRFSAAQSPVTIERYQSRWTGSHVEVRWVLNDFTSDVNFVVYRAEEPDDPFTRLYDPVVARRGGEFVFTDRSAAPGKTLRYRVVVLEGSETVAFFETTVHTAAPSLELRQNRPNPFNPITVIEFSTDRAAPVSLRIFDVSGKLVRTLIERNLPPGEFRQSWDGSDTEGNSAASGVYFYRLRVGNRTLTRKAVLLR